MWFWAFRYALGRHTGAVNHVVGFILDPAHWDYIPKRDLKQMVDEIKQYYTTWPGNEDLDAHKHEQAEWNRIVLKYQQEHPHEADGLH